MALFDSSRPFAIQKLSNTAKRTAILQNEPVSGLATSNEHDQTGRAFYRFER
jgi:hypothetical protein